MALDFDPIVPAPLTPGSRVAVIAPSSPFDRALVLRGLGWLEQRYRVQFDPSLFDEHGFLAGNDERRSAELDRVLRDPELRAVVTARGGYGLGRIACRADWAALRAHPKWLVGFSDATWLHAGAWRAGVASLHAANVGGLGRGDEHARDAFRAALEAPLALRSFGGLTTWSGGRARGPLLGGNLTLLESIRASGFARLPRGAILVLEDVTEQAYRVDRMLSALLAAGAFDAVAGVVVGDFTDCPDSRGVAVADVLAERLRTLRVPVAAGLRFGHGDWNEPLPFGPVATLDASNGTLQVGTQTVS